VQDTEGELLSVDMWIGPSPTQALSHAAVAHALTRYKFARAANYRTAQIDVFSPGRLARWFHSVAVRFSRRAAIMYTCVRCGGRCFIGRRRDLYVSQKNMHCSTFIGTLEN
jgi:hypothetical protein